MKNSILILVCLFVANLLSAQNTKYISMMEKNILQMDSVQSFDEIQKVANTFERISNVEKGEWLPSYYLTLCQIRMASMSLQNGDTDKVSAFVDKAQAAIDHCKTLVPEESEVVALQGYVYTARIWADPMVAGQKYSPLAMQAYHKAVALNDKNPRAYFLRGQHVFFTPEFWGGGAKNAHSDLKTADKYFKNGMKESSIHPSWGANNNGYLLSKAETEDTAKTNGDK